ncbi:response regulator [Gracilibacillus oryzae]|uniref:Response regulator n=1 Tax=Gracilibacillus oryzae TaxID=1672701 RepID=A0A7C8GTE8_9BACI|nr:response regulator [Gracilibacillus oryzae]KAB8131748.1 response regulator [Gracilibacillus oryzae]
MYKVLLVDDERMILDGISIIVDWENHQTELIGKAMNGLEALALIEEEEPDIVITDITMPGLDGIGLVAKASEKFPSVKWIFLSGYDEFEYARQAMKFGVRHYLLKPCNENQISEALSELILEKKEEEQTLQYMETIQQEASKLSEYEQEDILKRFLTDITPAKELYEKMSNIIYSKFERDQYQLILFHCEKANTMLAENQWADLAAFFDTKALISTIIDNNLLVLLEADNKIAEKIKLYQDTRQNNWSIVISPQYSVKGIIDTKLNYYDLIMQLFYQSKGQVISSDNFIEFQTNIEDTSQLDLNQLIVHLKKQSDEKAMTLITQFGEELKQHKISPKIAKGYFIQFYLLLMSKLHSVMQEDRFETISKLESFLHLETFYHFFDQLFTELIKTDPAPRRYSAVVQQLMEWIEKEIHNPELSLQWLANNCLFMNADYLGKVFKKEVGQRFSSYVTNARINKAIEIIELEEDIKVFELAERLGFGTNPQYFSQLFKRIKGFTPSEIIKNPD